MPEINKIAIKITSNKINKKKVYCISDKYNRKKTAAIYKIKNIPNDTLFCPSHKISTAFS